MSNKNPLAVLYAASCLGVLAAASAQAADSESTKVGGKMFVDFSSIEQKSNGVKTDLSGIGLDVKRFYVAIDHNFDDMWSANVTTDFNYVSNDSQTQVLIKKAYVQAKLSDAFIARAGSADLPWVPFAEGLYGYRYVELELIDRTKFGTSADWGMHAGGKSGMFAYAVSMVNGAGYKNTARTKSVDFEGRVSVVPVAGLTLAAGFYNGKLGQDLESNTAEHTAERWTALAAWSNDRARVGAEYFAAKNWKQVQGVPTDKSDGYSTWASFNFSKTASVFARYDSVNPSKDLAPNLENTYFHAGVAVKPRKNVDIAFVYKQEKNDNGSWATSNFGSSVVNGKHDEIGVFGQIAF